MNKMVFLVGLRGDGEKNRLVKKGYHLIDMKKILDRYPRLRRRLMGDTVINQLFKRQLRDVPRNTNVVVSGFPNNEEQAGSVGDLMREYKLVFVVSPKRSTKFVKYIIKTFHSEPALLS